jgi:hypothetical protein
MHRSAEIMKPRQLALIALRTLAIFLVFRGLEFGISQYLQLHYSLHILSRPVDEEMRMAFGIIRTMTVVAAFVPIGLAFGLWFSAPLLARFIAPAEEDSSSSTSGASLRDSLMMAGAIIIIGVGASSLPKILFEYRVEHRKDRTITLSESKVFPDMLQVLGKVLVGGTMLPQCANDAGERA